MMMMMIIIKKSIHVYAVCMVCSLMGTSFAASVLQVVDMLVFKGQEELQYCVDHSKQRHHLLGQYIIGKEGLAGDVHKLGETDHGESEFLKNFYRGNN